jgi:hypothetical protein
LFYGCSIKQPNKSESLTIVFKTPAMKFYDRGFLNYYDDYIHLQILNIGVVVLDLRVYKHKICKSRFRCMKSKEFNKLYLSDGYDKEFLYNLLSRKNIKFKDKKNHILIKVIKE